MQLFITILGLAGLGSLTLLAAGVVMAYTSMGVELILGRECEWMNKVAAAVGLPGLIGLAGTAMTALGTLVVCRTIELVRGVQ